jgi:hypothetical protein
MVMKSYLCDWSWSWNEYDYTILMQYHGKQIDLSDNKYSIVNRQENSIFVSKKKIFVSQYDPKKSDIMKLSCWIVSILTLCVRP